jgi:glycosyltransferase involved in cell wall biosynthesis
MTRRLSGSGPIRVTYFVEGDVFGGVERHLLHVLDELDRERFEPIVLGAVAEELLRELEIRSIPSVPLPRVRSKANVRGWIRVARAVNQSRPDVFHAMLAQSYGAQYALVAAIVRSTRAVVVTAHLPTPSDNRRQNLLRRLLLRGVDLQIIPSEWTQVELRRLGQLHVRFAVVSNGIALPPLPTRDEARRALGIPATATVVGGCMRLVDWKRPDLVVEAARLFPGAVVVLLGDGPEKEHLQSMTGGVDLRLPGFQTDAVNLLPAFDVFVHPCPSDNQPLAVLEAMGAGIPVVVADTGGSALMVDDGRTGLKAPATAEGMAGAVGRLLADRELRKTLADGGQAEVNAHFTAAVMTQRLEELYDRLLGIGRTDRVGQQSSNHLASIAASGARRQ